MKKEMKGLLCFIYKHDNSDASNRGISHYHDKVILVGEGIPEIFSPSETTPAVILENHYKDYWRAIPADNDGKWPMFGGCFIHTSDSRFPFSHPIALHDRYEE